MRSSTLERKLVAGVLSLFLIPTLLVGGVLYVLYRNGTLADPSALAVAAARHQIDEADFIDLAQVHLVEDRAGGHGAVDIELDPAHVGERELGVEPVAYRAVCPIADQPGAVGELHDRTNLMEA